MHQCQDTSAECDLLGGADQRAKTKDPEIQIRGMQNTDFHARVCHNVSHITLT